MTAVRLLALDIDGTLLRNDGQIASIDRKAIAKALNRGIAVTLATGRLTSSALPFATELALAQPLVCADGAVVYCPTTLAPLELNPLAAMSVAAFQAGLESRGLAVFLFTHEAVWGSGFDIGRFGFVSGFAPRVVAREDGEPHASEVIAVVGIGAESVVRAADGHFSGHPAAEGERAVFPLTGTGQFAVRFTPAGCTKATGLAFLAQRLGITAAQVAAVGDWHNDVPMLAWAGRSFAMGQAPEAVDRVAKHKLRATADTGGGIAEALATLL
jgi:hypothetical protein